MRASSTIEDELWKGRVSLDEFLAGLRPSNKIQDLVQDSAAVDTLSTNGYTAFGQSISVAQNLMIGQETTYITTNYALQYDEHGTGAPSLGTESLTKTSSSKQN
eukprot:Skav214819  [mRNA]  locus=scaffold1934:181405:185616:+ [translate_table: standard]